MNEAMKDSTASPADRIQAAVQLHVLSAVSLISEAIPYLKKSKGSIVNVSSVLSVIPYPVGQPYCIAKAAQDALTRNMALEYASAGVRVNSILPGKACAIQHPWSPEMCC